MPIGLRIALLCCAVFTMTNAIHGAEKIQEYKVRTTFIAAPIYYDHAFYGVNTNGNVVRITLEGKESWVLDQTTTKWDIVV